MLAAAALLAGDRGRLEELLELAERQAGGPVLACPECGALGPHDDNGATGDRRAFSCSACGLCFDAGP